MKMMYVLMLVLALVGGTGRCEAARQLDWADKALWYEGDRRLGSVDSTLPDVIYFLPTCVSDWTDSTGTVRHNADPYRADHLKAWQLSAELADTIFATRANLFLPYYRQATFGGLQGEAVTEACGMAVGDALSAFDYYLKHYNHGRPFILAGYSQGGMMVKEVLKHMDDDTYGHLIAAYVVGYGVTAADTLTQPGHRMSHVQLALDSLSHGVTVNFNSVTAADAASALLSDGNIGCINPVSWTTSAEPATLLGAGAAPRADDARFPYGTAVVPRVPGTAVTVRVDSGRHVLLVDGLDAHRYTFAPLGSFFPLGNLHLQELFFYADCLRHNVLLRSGYAGPQHAHGGHNNR